MTRETAFDELDLQDFLIQIPLPQKKKNSLHRKKKKVIVIAGPTCVGKTQASLLIAQAIGGEIISADSMQVYTGMDIGTAKPTTEERRRISHHLIDTRDLDESFNVADFCQEACASLREIFAKQHVPLIVGGTGFYIHALLYGAPGGPPSVPNIREKLEQEMQEKGPQHLYERLRLLDPIYALTITQGDRHKIIRALEIMALTDRKVSDFERTASEDIDDYDFRCWFLYMPKEVLYPRIEKRCDEMIANGFIDEVRMLEKQGLRKNTSASQAIGYRQGLKFLDSPQTKEDWEQFVKEFKQASRRYAKRQFTWFKKETLFRCLNLTETSLEHAVELIIQDYELGD